MRPAWVFVWEREKIERERDDDDGHTNTYVDDDLTMYIRRFRLNSTKWCKNRGIAFGQQPCNLLFGINCEINHFIEKWHKNWPFIFINAIS